ncbi:MAG: hypothetical protein OQJ91_00465 [Motiliproteus sp.]|nr:hypothetical protein [Motiliproteus sp.]
MQIPAISTAVQSPLGVNRNDGAPRTSADALNEGQSENSVQATGQSSGSEAVQPVEENLNEVASADGQAALTTQVVTAADEVLGTSLGLNIDTTA